MNRKQIAKRLDEVRKEINRLSSPKDPVQTKRDKLVDELNDLINKEHDCFNKAVKETRKLLAKELKELGAMCKRKFYDVVPVKAKVGIKLDLDATNLSTHDSTCDVQIEFPKFSRNLGLFAFDDEESLSSAGIHIATQAKGLLPELDKHLKKLENLQKMIIKRVKEEAKKHYLPKHEMDEFLEEVMG